MSFTPFKEVSVANPGSGTRYGSDDLLDVMKILNAKVVANRRPEIINPWRWSSWQEIKQVTEASVTTPSTADVAHLFLSATDNKLKVKKTGGIVINLEDVGSGTWSNTSTETFSNKTVNIDTNTLKHSTTNATGDIMFYDATAGKYIRLAKGTANQSLTVNTAGTTLEWATVTGGGGGGEANTASNVGSAGIGVFYQKLGVDLQFKQLFSPDASINISDDTGNQKIDITLAGSFVKTSQANTYGDFLQTIRSSKLAITNPANTFAYLFTGSAIVGTRTLTLPLLSANDTLVTEDFTQTLTNKTLSTGTIASTDTITLKHSTTNTLGELLVNTGTKFDRRAKGAANTYLKVNASGTDLEWGSVSAGALDDLTDVTISAPAVKQTLRHNGTNWINSLLSLDDLSDAVITTPAAGHYLKHDGANWINSLLPLNDLSDVVIATPSTNQVVQFNGTNWVNATLPSGTAREDLCAQFGMATQESLGSSYIDALWTGVTGPGGFTDEGTKAVMPIDFTGKTQYRVVAALVVEGGSMTPDIKLVDDSTPANTLHEFANAAQGTRDSGLTTLPGWCTGVKTLRLMMGGGSGNTNVFLPSTSVYLK